MGNRGGCLHDPQTKQLSRRRWASRRWIACVLSFKDRRRTVMGVGYTELFFLDEATALAAGHRPCFECRRADARGFADAWARAVGVDEPPKADAMDRILHAERLTPLSARPSVALADLPDGAAVLLDGVAHIIFGGAPRAWSPAGYGVPATAERATLLTPSAIVAVLKAGYRPQLAA